jgi:hypothetical protein
MAMKKNVQKLVLTKETLKDLEQPGQVVGGARTNDATLCPWYTPTLVC